MYFRNGRGSAFAQRHHPDRIIQLDAGFRGDRFATRRPLLWRAAVHPARFLGRIFRGHWIGAAAQVAYLAGYGREWLTRREPAPRQGELQPH